MWFLSHTDLSFSFSILDGMQWSIHEYASSTYQPFKAPAGRFAIPSSWLFGLKAPLNDKRCRQMCATQQVRRDETSVDDVKGKQWKTLVEVDSQCLDVPGEIRTISWLKWP